MRTWSYFAAAGALLTLVPIGDKAWAEPAETSQGLAVQNVAPPVNPYLAPSANPAPHRNSAQQDSSAVRGPEGPTRVIPESDLDWFFTGPGHYGAFTGVKAKDGRRVDWTSGRNAIIKYDGAAHKVLAVYNLGPPPVFTEAQADAALTKIFATPPQDRPIEALKLSAQIQSNLVGIYSMVDRDGRFYVGSDKGVTVYGDSVPGDAESPIKVLKEWAAPATRGKLIGINMTYDGWVVFVSEGGDVIVVNRDFTQHHMISLPHSEQSMAMQEKLRKSGEPTWSWVRNSYAVDEQGGIYIASAGYIHKVVWTGGKLSIAAKDGAWSEPYRDGTGLGTGATPVLMGFGPEEDHLVVFTDGDAVMNVTAYWRDRIPAGWKPPAGAPSPRLAGFARADMGNPNATDVQSEQATVVSGYGALVVNNEPASVPAGYPKLAKRALVGLLGADPRFTPHGLQKFEWNPKTRKMELAWTSDVASPNVVPFVSASSNLAYTMGVREGRWTFEGIDWDTGKSAFHYILPGEKYNGFYSGLIQSDEGDIVFGTPFGRARIKR